MALPDKREDAERLYVRQSLSCPAIAAELGVNEGTVYRWKAEAAEKGEALDWDVRRRIYNMSPRELTAIYAETLKSWLIKIKANPELLSDPKIADAISKHISVMQKIDTRSQYLGVITDLIKVTNSWLAENQPELKAKLDPYWDAIYQELVAYSTKRGLF
jgi:transposase-like protein